MRSFIFSIFVLMIVSCKSKVEYMEPVLERQQIGIISAHNARQLGGYVIGNKRVKQDLLLRSARLSGLSTEDSALLADKYKVQRIYDFRSEKEILAAPDVIPGATARSRWHSAKKRRLARLMSRRATSERL